MYERAARIIRKKKILITQRSPGSVENIDGITSMEQLIIQITEKTDIIYICMYIPLLQLFQLFLTG